MDLRFENTCKPPASKGMKSFEQEWNIKLPDEYKEFLCKNNGGNPTVRRFKTLDGKHTSSLTLLLPFSEEVRKNVKNVFFAFHTNHVIPSNFLIIGEDPIDNKICLSLSKEDAGAVYYWRLDMEDIYKEGYQPSYTYFSIIANSFTEFINSLKEK
ncbi:SMI1/KNR4 family protein [Priestia megaterium]|uniref:SMI1/KNR4 family protein n=1 Tax=Priestia megaterium TaxID=1404 RepID=UPI002675F1E1|nr:SMI1/KNR4 family protein [Priestia megaterium]WKU21111.1 SMI1/KNR4 family protein [Priestia megaterium]